MNNYIAIQSVNAKAPVFAADSPTGYAALGFGNGRVWQMNDYFERECCTLVYTPSLRGPMVDWLNANFVDLFPDEIDDFFAKFKDRYPLTPVEDTLKEIKTLGENGFELWSSYFKTSVKITQKLEADMLEVIKHPVNYPDFWNPFNGTPTIENVLMQNIEEYCQQYSINTRYKKYANMRNEEILWHFCLAHGVDRNYVSQKKIEMETTWDGAIMGLCVLTIVAFLPFLLISGGIILLALICSIM